MNTEQDAVAVERIPMQVPSEKIRLTEGVARAIQDEYESGGTAFDMATAAIAAHNACLRERSREADVVEAMVDAGYAASVNAVWGADEVERTGRQIVAVAHGAGLTAALTVLLGKESTE